jgi:hypothetical protein
MMGVSEEYRFRRLLFVLVSFVIVRGPLSSHMPTKRAETVCPVSERFGESRLWHVIGWRPYIAGKFVSDA